MSEVFFQGATTKVVLPSSREVDIRETNGADDELLSNLGGIKDSTNFAKFLTSIIVFDSTLNRKPEISDVLNYHKNDKWFLILKQRIINRGTELTFKYNCSCSICKDKPAGSYTEDLTNLDADLSRPNYSPTENQISKYPLGLATKREFRTSSGHLFQYDIMTGIHEKKELDFTEDEQNRNTKLIVRNLKIKNGDEWQTVTNFGFISSKDLSQLRADLKVHDPEFHPLVFGECPNKVPFALSLWGMPDFFWPGEEI